MRKTKVIAAAVFATGAMLAPVGAAQAAPAQTAAGCVSMTQRTWTGANGSAFYTHTFKNNCGNRVRVTVAVDLYPDTQIYIDKGKSATNTIQVSRYEGWWYHNA